MQKHTRHRSSCITFLCRCDGAGVESKTLALSKSKGHEPLKDAADYAAAVMGSEYDNSYGWAFDTINRSVTIWEGLKFQYEDEQSTGMREKFKLRSRCEIKYAFTSAEGEVQFEPGVVLCRDVIGTGKWEVFDVLKRTAPMVMCTPCSNACTRPVRHREETCPHENSGTSLDAEVDGVIQPGQARVQGVQKGKAYMEALSKANTRCAFLTYIIGCTVSVSSPHSYHSRRERSPADILGARAGTSKRQVAPTNTW